MAGQCFAQLKFDGHIDHFQPKAQGALSFLPEHDYPTTLAKFAPNAAAKSERGPFTAVKRIAALLLVLEAAALLDAEEADTEEGGAAPVGTE